MFAPKALWPAVRRVVFRQVTAIAAIVALFSFPANAQDTSPVLTTTMLKRIAQAVDGRRSGEIVYLVLHRDSATVAVVTPSRPDAEAIRKKLGEHYILVGPFVGTYELGPLFDLVPSDCVHDGNTSNMIGLICNGQQIHRSQISSMSLVLRMRNGSTRTIALPSGTDAVFLSYPAFDKFVFPYYERVIGFDATSAMRQRMLTRDMRR